MWYIRIGVCLTFINLIMFYGRPPLLPTLGKLHPAIHSNSFQVKSGSYDIVIVFLKNRFPFVAQIAYTCLSLFRVNTAVRDRHGRFSCSSTHFLPLSRIQCSTRSSALLMSLIYSAFLRRMQLPYHSIHPLLAPE